MQGDEVIYKIALAAYFHDIGKLAQRAKASKEQNEVVFHIDKDFFEENKRRYLPFYDGKYTHLHALYTAAFINYIEKLLPKEFNYENWGLQETFIDLAASHHKPDTPLQWIIAIADRVSSAFERTEFEKYNKEPDSEDYWKIRLIPLFEEISFDDNTKQSLEDFNYIYSLEELHPLSIFPKEINTKDKSALKNEYNELFFNFICGLEKIEHKNNIPLWFEHFDSLFMIYASNIPSATFNVIPDTPLYDHSKMTSALATALYLYHNENKSFNLESIKDYASPKFAIVQGNFYGIQNFIFSDSSGTFASAAKLLRGRSFLVSLLSELIAHWVCEELNLTPSSIIFNAAGQFTIIAPNIQDTINKIKLIEEKINEWLYGDYYCETSFGLIYQEASCDDLINEQKYNEMWNNIRKKIQKKKYQKIDIEKYCGPIQDYLDRFDNKLGKKICPFCAKRPSSRECEDDKYLGDIKSSCKVCRDQIFIGHNLVKSYRIAIIDSSADIQDEKLFEPLLGKYQIIFIKRDEEKDKVGKYIKHAKLIKYWDISLPSKDQSISKDIAVKWINAYVPKYDEKDEKDPRYDLDIESKENKDELLKKIKDKDLKTFNHIALTSINYHEDNGKRVFEGVEALGILKADIDNLGKIFSMGFKKKSLSKTAFLSRQINIFFSFYIPYLLKTNENFKDIYTIFAGGDDLFLLGPWNAIIQFAEFITKEFNSYVCKHEQITLSIGIAVCKTNEPIYTYAYRSEASLKSSKETKGKNSITLFNEIVNLKDNFLDLKTIKDKLEQWYNKEYINNAMLFRFNNFIKDAQTEKDIMERKIKEITISELDSLKWRALFKYIIARNAAKNYKQNEREEAIKEIEEVAKWLASYGSKFKIPLWQLIYNKRKIREVKL